MKRNILVIGILAIIMIGSDAMAQRGRGDRRDNRGNDRVERRNDRRDHDRVVRNGRRERVVDRRFVRYDGYRSGSYYRQRPARDFRRFENHGRRFRPSNRHIWINGHWNFNRRLGRDVWIDGRWVVRTKHHRWIAGHYTRQRGVRVWIPGCWVRF